MAVDVALALHRKDRGEVGEARLHRAHIANLLALAVKRLADVVQNTGVHIGKEVPVKGRKVCQVVKFLNDTGLHQAHGHRQLLGMLRKDGLPELGGGVAVGILGLKDGQIGLAERSVQIAGPLHEVVASAVFAHFEHAACRICHHSLLVGRSLERAHRAPGLVGVRGEDVFSEVLV